MAIDRSSREVIKKSYALFTHSAFTVAFRDSNSAACVSSSGSGGPLGG